MASAEQLEALIKLESDLKAQYEKKLTVERYKVDAHLETQNKLQATIAQQAADINALKAGSSELKRIEQENRELKNRVENIRNEYDAQRAKTKSSQKELIELRSEVKDLKQLDAKKIKKNLVDTKKKLDEQRTANTLLSNNIKKQKQENHEHLKTIAELEQQLEELKSKADNEPESAEIKIEAEAEA